MRLPERSPRKLGPTESAFRAVLWSGRAGGVFEHVVEELLEGSGGAGLVGLGSGEVAGEVLVGANNGVDPWAALCGDVVAAVLGMRLISPCSLHRRRS